MTTHDTLGHTYSGATAQSLEHFDLACADFRCFINDPLAGAQTRARSQPRHDDGARAGGLPEPAGHRAGRPAGGARGAAGRAALPADEREAMHCRAVQHLVNGRWHAAGRVLEDLSIRYPRDLLALQVGHQIDFFTGHSRMLRDRIARAEAHGTSACPATTRCWACYAFGLEETGDYARAEAIGRRARRARAARRLGLARGGARDGDAEPAPRRHRLAGGNADTWSEGSFFALHNWWHLALFHLGLDEIDEVLELVDAARPRHASPVVLDMIDASALLWRLHLRGVDVGNRWHALAERWSVLAEAGNYAFNDLHAMMAFVGADRQADAARLLATQARALQVDGDNAQFLREVGRAATQAVQAFGGGPLWRGGATAAPAAQQGASLRRQPRAARPDRPDADRGRRARRPDAVRRCAEARAGGAFDLKLSDDEAQRTPLRRRCGDFFTGGWRDGAPFPPAGSTNCCNASRHGKMPP